VIWVWGQTVPVRDEYGNVARHIGTVTDVTDRKVAEGEAVIAMTNAETANRAKSDFLSSMSPGCVKTIGALSVLGGSGFEVRAETGFPLLGV